MRNTSYTVNFTCLGSTFEVMFNIIPLFICDMTLQFGFILVNTETDDSNISSPVSASSFNHINVVSHWCLAWWAPCSPEINHPNLSGNMFKTNSIFTVHGLNISDSLVLISCAQQSLDFHVAVRDSINHTLYTGIEFICLLTLIGFQVFLNLQ